MMQVLDRLMVGSYIKSYVICLISLLSLWIVVDLFMNLSEFAHVNDGLRLLPRARRQVLRRPKQQDL